MRIVPRASVRVNLILAILLTIVLSWVLSTGIANYVSYLGFRSLRQEMLAQPQTYPQPIPEPRFGIVEFFTGRPPMPPGGGHPPPPDHRPRPGGPPPGGGGMFEIRWLLVRLGVALVLAGLVGAWLGRRFTRPLTQLSKGAEAFHSGDFAYRIPARGRNEFSAVATAMNEMAKKVSGHIGDLEQDAERRRQFLADIAHELRSPVTTMRTMAGALQEGLADEPARRERAVSALVRTSERMLRLVQSLMELAKLDLDELPLDKVNVDLRELVDSAIQSHDAEAAAAGIVLLPLTGEAPPPGGGAPVLATVDPDRITQVLDNVLGNAVRHAGKGAKVTVSVEDGDPVVIRVSDTGKGIPPADLPHVLDPFFRADAARTPGDSHTGLGLSIASRLVEAHGGRLTVSSEEGKGTTVTIKLPKDQPSPVG